MIKEQIVLTYKKGGTTLYFVQRAYGFVCVDIDISPDSKIVYFCCNKSFYIELRQVTKQFSQITQIYVDKTVKGIAISNLMFPNVNKILGSSNKYTIGKNILIDKEYCRLCNTFCKHPGEEIALENVKYISDSAFEGCMSNNITAPNLKNMAYGREAFNGFAGKMTRKNGLYYVGDLLYDVDHEADVVDFPRKQNRPEYVKCSDGPVNQMIIHDYCSIFSFSYPDAKKVYIADDCDINCFRFSKSCEHFEVDTDNEHFTSIDGIIYSKDKTTLLKCPIGKTGTVVIPEGVVVIGEAAFLGTAVETVVFPQSVKIVEDNAFYESKVSTIEFNHNSIFLHRTVFGCCQNIKEIEIPAETKLLSENAFMCCNGLEKVTLCDGIEEIAYPAFRTCKNLQQISIPKSMKNLGKEALVNFNEITIEGDIIPDGLIKAVSTISYGSLCCDCYTIAHFNNGKSICIPRYMSLSDIEKISKKIPKTVHDLDKQDLTHLFVYSKPGNCKYITALQTYMINCESDEFTKNYLRKLSSKFIDIFEEFGSEKMLTYFVKMDILTKKAKQKAIDLAQRKNWTTVLAYLLHYTDRKTNTSFKL